jgi:P27 family predicted phage terminase small subunit
MGRTPGAKPAPLALIKLRGTYRQDRHKKREGVEAPGDLREPPDYLTESQKAGWRFAIENAPAGILRNIDRSLLFTWVEAEDRHRTAAMMQAKIDANNRLPLLTKGSTGTMVPSPYLKIMNVAARIMLVCAGELGFTPTARPRLAELGAAESDEEQQWARLRVLQGGKASG